VLAPATERQGREPSTAQGLRFAVTQRAPGQLGKDFWMQFHLIFIQLGFLQGELSREFY